MLYKREKYLRKVRPFYHDDDIIKVITGVRRCGKSSLMETIADELEHDGVKTENIIYIDLEKRGNRKIKTPDQLEALIESKIVSDGLNYLFIDEIQNVKGFEEVINGFRSDGGFSIFITGSNSYLLSGELMTKLTGRYIEFEMFPLSFEEYEQMKQFYGKPINSNETAEFNAYIFEGGFPKTVLLDDMLSKRRYVTSLISEIYDKDIRRRVKIKDKSTFEIVRGYVINNFGATMSIKSLTDALNHKGIRINRSTVSKYVSTLVDAKILYECDRFDMKSKKMLSGEKKYYLSDLSFYFASNTDNRINYGPVLENVVYIYSRSRDYSVSVGRIGKLECDFILRRETNIYSYVQVAFMVMGSKETEDREYKSLEMIRDNYSKYVMTMDSLLQKRNGINHVNLIDSIKAESDF